MERSRRSRGGPSKAAESLAKIREARLTGQAASYEVGEVDGIFEEVDEQEYENIREKRATGDFIVGDDDRHWVILDLKNCWSILLLHFFSFVSLERLDIMLDLTQGEFLSASRIYPFFLQ